MSEIDEIVFGKKPVPTRNIGGSRHKPTLRLENPDLLTPLMKKRKKSSSAPPKQSKNKIVPKSATPKLSKTVTKSVIPVTSTSEKTPIGRKFPVQRKRLNAAEMESEADNDEDSRPPTDGAGDCILESDNCLEPSTTMLGEIFNMLGTVLKKLEEQDEKITAMEKQFKSRKRLPFAGSSSESGTKKIIPQEVQVSLHTMHMLP